jgi:hypothetical protein
MSRRLCRGLLITLAGFGCGALVGAASAAGASAGGTHAAISIQSNSDFSPVGASWGCACVVSGWGTGNPYVIGPWTINNVNGTAVDVQNTTHPFVLQNLTIAGNANPLDVGIHLGRVSGAAVTGTQTSIENNNIGILVENSSGVVLDGGGANPNGPGIGSAAGSINQNALGAVDIESSDHITVAGWQMSANGQDHLAPGLWVNLDPGVASWGVGGVRFFGVTYSKIDHNAANNDTDISYSLFNSSHNSISNNTADYPLTSNLMLSDGSSYNTISGNEFSTADFVGILIADPLSSSPLSPAASAHDNVVTNNVDHTDGGTGAERHAGIAPAFEGGIVILNGAYNNAVTANQATANAGADLVWAQEVLNPSTPIGVDTFPPDVSVDVCNVTQSDGGSDLASRNGNTWSNNVVKHLYPCIPPQRPAP